MATGLLLAEFEANLNISTAAPMDAGDLPMFGMAQEVFRAFDFPTTANTDYKRTSYTVVGFGYSPGDDGGATKLMDQDLNPAVPSDQTSARTIEGWQHTTTPGATRGATTLSSPWFYDVLAASGETLRGIHQSQLTDLTNIKTFVGADVASGWT